MMLHVFGIAWSGGRLAPDGRLVFDWRMRKDQAFHRLYVETLFRRSLLDRLLRRDAWTMQVCGVEVSMEIDVDDPIANLATGLDGQLDGSRLDDVPARPVDAMVFDVGVLARSSSAIPSL